MTGVMGNQSARMRLSHRDFESLQETLLQLYEFRDLPAFQAAAPQIILQLIPCEAMVWVQFRLDVATRRAVLTRYVAGAEVQRQLDGRDRDASLVYSHPFNATFVKRADQRALKLSDFLTVRQFRQTALYAEVYGPMRFDQELGCTIDPAPGSNSAALTLERRRLDFSERDRLLLTLLRPHFDKAHKNAQLASAWLGERGKPPVSSDLTPRESEVATWLAQGKTNAEIAIILRAQPRTIEKHVEKILAKLGVENRTAAAVCLSTEPTPSRPTS